jgi:hypothetical protein
MATKVKLIETGAVTGNIIPDGGIATAKLADDAVTTIKISDGNITHEKLHTSMDLTGKTVTVATAAGSTNTTAAASTAFVQQELTTLIGGAPSTLDTLNELAAAINDDASYASTLTTALATKAPLASPTFTGTPLLSNRFKTQDGSAQMNMGQWDGSNHRIEADSNRPFKIYSYNTSGGIALGISGNDKLTINGDGSGIDVTGTVTADGLDVDTGDAGNGLNYGFDVKNAASGSATSYAMPAISWSNGGLRWASVHGERNPVGGYGGSFVVNTMNPAGSAVKRLGIDLNGDISFYEDTGTTPKFFWDASAEDLQIGGNLLNLSGVSSGTTGARLSANGGGMLRLASGGVDALYVVDGGNVGIGTDNPTAKVQINNAADSRLIIFETGTSPYTSTLELASQGLGTYGATVQYTSSAERLTLENYGRTISAASYSGSIAFKTKLNNTTPTEVMFIHGFTGNVGIGTSAPTNKFGINRTSINTNERMINLYTGTTGAGNYVSIGAQYSETNALSNSEIRFGNEVQSNAPSFLAFATGNTSTPTERMRIDSGGDMIYGGATGVHEKYFSGFTTGNGTFSHDITHTVDSGTGTVLEIKAAFTHHPSYDCILHTWISRRDTTVSHSELFRRDTTLSGSWTVSRVSATVTRVTKNAGTYNGGGPYWIKAIWRNY